MVSIDVGKKLKEFRLEAGYTQEDIAEFLNRDVTGISKIENGKRKVEADVFLSWLAECAKGPVILDFREEHIFQTMEG